MSFTTLRIDESGQWSTRPGCNPSGGKNGLGQCPSDHNQRRRLGHAMLRLQWLQRAPHLVSNAAPQLDVGWDLSSRAFGYHWLVASIEVSRWMDVPAAIAYSKKEHVHFQTFRAAHWTVVSSGWWIIRSNSLRYMASLPSSKSCRSTGELLEGPAGFPHGQWILLFPRQKWGDW